MSWEMRQLYQAGCTVHWALVCLRNCSHGPPTLELLSEVPGKPFRDTKLATVFQTYERVDAEISERIISGNTVKIPCVLDEWLSIARGK